MSFERDYAHHLRDEAIRELSYSDHDLKDSYDYQRGRADAIKEIEAKLLENEIKDHEEMWNKSDVLKIISLIKCGL